jgi:hypothetical protein
MNFSDWGELCISSQNQRRDLVGEAVACTGEHISYIYVPEMCYTIQYVSYLDSIVNFRHFIYMLVKIFSLLFSHFVLFCHTKSQILVSVFLCACLCIFAMCVVHIGSQEKKCLPFKCIHRVPVFDIFQNSLNIVQQLKYVCLLSVSNRVTLLTYCTCSLNLRSS